MNRGLRQYRTILGTHLACIMFRHIARKSWPIQEVFPAIFRQSDENSDCAIYAPELCGVALKLYDAIIDPVPVVRNNLWSIVLPIAAAVIVAGVILLILRKRKTAKKKKDE